MRVSIDATPLLLRSAGVKTYVYYWVQYLVRAAGPKRRVRLFPLLDTIGECVHERSVAGPLRTAAGIALLQAGNYIQGPILDLIGRRTDIFHHSSQQLRQAPRGCRITATIHDLTCWLMPEMHTAANVRVNHEFARNVLARASGMIAVSGQTRDDAVRILGLDPAKIRVIYNGVAPAFFDAAALEAPKPYVLFVGTVEPRKNIAALLDAWSQLPPSVRQEFDLVLAGPAGWGDTGIGERLASAGPGVRYLGYVPEADLPALNAGATAFVYPSLYEGFGLPLAQAMAAGVPAVTSAVSSLPEVAAGAALLVDPRSAADICAALERLLLSPSLREELGARGRRRAEEYRWETCAAKSWEFFEQVGG
ncbi:MAG TPA: glycosyltransferase family 1 protein [Bryobacteraceae bacterium]|nr:glycosyltransferase family 1 protein [Bryobacteraceae bacterium]